MTPYWIILGLILLALVAPVEGVWRSFPRLLVAMFLSFVVVVLPLFVFFFSSFMLPEWKGVCRYGWVDGFIVGKLAFTPFVLVATAALYRYDVLRERSATDRWPTVGIYLGAIAATTCLVFGFFCLKWQIWMLVPLYVAVWYVIRALQLLVKSPVGFWTYFWATLSTLPSWLTAWQWSSQVYESLPNQPPTGCFVVTAASRGHRKVVGPFFEIRRCGQSRQANQQLITLWLFENRWREKFPRSHQNFRRIYNRLGPMLAARIRSPWLADVAFVVLKPAEWFARFCLRHNINAPD